jgi:hypothetical protein
MTVRRWRSVAALGVAAGLGVLSGCATSGSATGDSAPSTSTSYFSPLNEYLTPPESGAMPTTDEQWQAKEGEVQALVAACMTEQGFEYIPFVYPSGGMGMGMGMDEEFGQRAWAEKYGYGMSTFDDQGPADPVEVDDPNTALVAGMSDGEREAYFKALHGGQFAGDMAAEQSSAEGSSADGSSTEGSSTEQPGETAVPIPEQDLGCWGAAQAEVYGQGFVGGGDEFQDMWDSMSQLWESTQSDERLVQVNADWAACMGEAGHPGFTLQQDAMQDVSTRWSELNGWPEPGEEMETATELTAEPTRPPAEAVSKFQAEEIALAVADFDCQEKVGYQKLFETVRIEAESQFVQDHRAELERYRDSLAGGGG